MFPTMFKIPYLPDWLADIKSYGVMMMIAFLTGIWLSCRRAYKSQANPDIVLNIGFIALIFGVVGARMMFVLHYWSERFANQPNPILAVFDIRAGGLEFWGGPLLVIPAVMVYLRYFAKASVRWYLDITMPALAWGLAITRIGCFLNGCCWGSLCVDEHDPAHQKAGLPWAVRFPYGSGPMVQQFKFGQLTLPKELITVMNTGESNPLPQEYIDARLKGGEGKLEPLQKAAAAASKALAEAQAKGADAATLEPLNRKKEEAATALRQYKGQTGIALVDEQCRKYDLTVEELDQLAGYYRSKPVHPAQLYETITAFIICWILSRLFYYRERHGIIGAWFLILYSVARFLLELIRQDNPLDVGGLTISQAISICTFAAGLLWMWVVYKKLPVMSPRAVPFEYPEEDETAPGRRGSRGRSERCRRRGW